MVIAFISGGVLICVAYPVDCQVKLKPNKIIKLSVVLVIMPTDNSV